MTIAIAMATYNGEQYIYKQLESIVNQTRKPDKIVIIDDASTDETVTITKNILTESHIPFEIIINDHNIGARDSFFKSIEYINQDIVFFSDQDDIWIRNKIEVMANVFEQNKDCALVVCDSLIWENKTSNKRLHKRLKINYRIDDEKLVDMEWYWRELIRRNIVTGMNMALSINAARITSGSISMLHDSWYAMIAPVFGKVYAIEMPLVKYRQHSNNVKGAKRAISRRKIVNSREKVKKAFCLKKERVRVIKEIDKQKGVLSASNREYLMKYDDFLTKQNSYIETGRFLSLLILKIESRYMNYLELDIRDELVSIGNFARNIKQKLLEERCGRI